MRFRKATIDDYYAVLQCVIAAFAGYAKDMGITPPPIREDYFFYIKTEEVIILEKDREAIGIIVLILKKGYLYLDVIAIKPEYQGKGYSYKMMDKVEEIARGMNYKQILLRSAILFGKMNYYDKFGYENIMIEEMDDRTVAHFRKELVY